jgi:hypothetical protein
VADDNILSGGFHMKKIIVLALAAIGIVAFSGIAFAADASANATATIQTAIACEKDVENITGGDLAFGTIVPDQFGGTVLISPFSGDRSVASGALALVPSVYGPAKFNVYGAANASYTVSLPDSIQILSGPNSMIVDTFTSNLLDGTSTLDPIGRGAFNVAATLHVAPLQADGLYSGTFTVSVDYN